MADPLTPMMRPRPFGPGDVGMYGINQIAPSLASLLRGERAPDRPAIPPDYVGKVPTETDKRFLDAFGEAAQAGVNLVGPPMKAATVAAAPLVAGIAKRVAPALQEAAPIARNAKAAPLFDYSRLSEVPDVPQFNLPRATPKKIPQEYLDLANNKQLMKELDKYVDSGIKQGGLGWYNLMPLREAYISELGATKGPKAFNDLMDAVAATSPDSKVPQNIRMASYYNMLRQNETALPERVKKPETGNWYVPPGQIPNPYGARAQALHVQNMENLINNGELPVLQNPKPPSFGANLKGNYEPVAIDRHEMRKLGLSGVPDNKYGFLENIEQQQAAKKGIAPAQYQSSGWLGGAEATNMMSGTEPALQHFENRIAATAEARGMTKENVLKQLIRAKMPLLSAGGVTALAMQKPQEQE